MTGFLQVDIDVLSKAAQALRNSEQVLGDAMRAMAKGGHGDIGPQKLIDAAESFQTRWKFGVERIGKSARDTGDGVAACCDAYRAQDQAFANALAAARAAVDPAQAPTGPGEATP